TLQEWTEDYAQLEDKHRHFSHMYGLYPGKVISVKKTPELIDACKAVLEQRGDGGTGFSRGWKMALWARLYDGNRANKIFKGYIKEQAYPQLFAKCYTPLQVDGSLGVTAAISEMLVQSHEGVIDLLPALPDEWDNGKFDGVCTRGGFELSFEWENKKLTDLDIISNAGEICRINTGSDCNIYKSGKKVRKKEIGDGVFEFETEAGALYNVEIE
ncbi:MAG: glycosyl hydrolase family 95 catalytic domain-containing protein, partial [Bacteroidota bacterium]